MKERILPATIIGIFLLLGSIVRAPEALTQGPPSPPSINADTVDGFHASATPQPNTLLALDANAKFPNIALYTGSGNGLDADLLDGLHASVFVQQGQANSVTAGMLVDNSVTGAKVSNITRVVTANQNYVVIMMPTGFSDAIYTFAIPYDYAGSDLRIREWFLIQDNGGTAKLFRWIRKSTPDGETFGPESNNPFDFVYPGIAYVTRIWTFPAAYVNPGDLFQVQLARQGDLPDDTMGRLELLGVAIEYTAEQ